MDNPKAGSCIADRKMSSGNQAQQEDDDQKAAAVILDQKQTTASPQKVLRAENETTPTSTAALVDDIEQYCQEMEALSLTTSPFSSSSSSSPVGKTAGT